jgi:hypothetical protein
MFRSTPQRDSLGTLTTQNNFVPSILLGDSNSIYFLLYLIFRYVHFSFHSHNFKRTYLPLKWSNPVFFLHDLMCCFKQAIFKIMDLLIMIIKNKSQKWRICKKIHKLTLWWLIFDRVFLTEFWYDIGKHEFELKS